MKADKTALALRLTLAWLLISLVVLFLYLVGTAQSFLEPTQDFLFRAVRWLSWLGLLACCCLLVPLTRKNRRRLAVALILAAGFASLFAFVLVWGSWVYPESGRLPW